MMRVTSPLVGSCSIVSLESRPALIPAKNIDVARKKDDPAALDIPDVERECQAWDKSRRVNTAHFFRGSAGRDYGIKRRLAREQIVARHA